MVTAGTGEPGFLIGVEDLINAFEFNDVSHYFLLTNGAHREEAWAEIIEDVIEFTTDGFLEDLVQSYVE